MKRTILIAHLILLLLLSACQSSPTKTAEPTVPPTVEPTAAPTVVIAPTATATTVPVESAYLAPDITGMYLAPNMSGMYPPPGNGELFPLVAGDESKINGKFFIDKVELKPTPGTTTYTDVVVTGNLPTPCHALKVNVTPPDNENKIIVQVYSLIEKDKVCTEQLKPFAGPVASLGGYPSGKYTVIVNDQPAGEFTIQ